MLSGQQILNEAGCVPMNTMISVENLAHRARPKMAGSISLTARRIRIKKSKNKTKMMVSVRETGGYNERKH
jgi:hypothetical protein